MIYCKMGSCDYDRKLCCNKCNRKYTCELRCDKPSHVKCSLSYEDVDKIKFSSMYGEFGSEGK